MVQSMSEADNPYDNAHMESFFSRFKAELMEGGAFQNAEDSQTEVFDYIEM
jgi:transposase InsO family protein